jgi:hypothetical protein
MLKLREFRQFAVAGMLDDPVDVCTVSGNPKECPGTGKGSISAKEETVEWEGGEQTDSLCRRDANGLTEPAGNVKRFDCFQ